MRIIKCVVLILMMLPLTVFAQEDSENPMYPAHVNRCVNLGNMLEAPNEGEWGVRVEEEYLATIAEAGFDSVRIPIRWSNHADEEAPYTIDEDFLARVHEVVDWSLEAGLNALINIHHYEEMMVDPEGHFERLNAIWAQIAESFADYPESVAFEVLNEPFNQLTFTIWNEMYPQLIETIRETNPERLIIVGGDQWNSFRSLENLVLPENTENLVVTFHFYEPFQFTHQAAEWVEGSNAWVGTTFGSDDDYAFIDEAFNSVYEWGLEHNVPVLLGEFGAYSSIDMDQRVLYTATIREKAESYGFGWCYWEFASGFGFYNPINGEFNELYRALIPESE